ncbi:hypothetical protein [Leptospira weilii]|uniref:hypothetical protein n=1 Tax=Leptospira weilii TaxID=28184 RepID=UPI0007740ADA|nr:hypothetical protein [Leptospira weilii]
MKRCEIGFPLTSYILAFSFLSISIFSSSNFPGKFHPHKQTINGVESEYKEPIQLEEEFKFLLGSLSLTHKNIPFVFKGKITSLQDRFQFHFCNIQTLNLSNLPPPSLA